MSEGVTFQLPGKAGVSSRWRDRVALARFYERSIRKLALQGWARDWTV